MHSIAKEVLEFWLPSNGTMADESFQKKWFGKSAELDEEITQKFGKYLEDAEKGKLDDCLGQGELNQLAHIILLDQFSRNVYRNTPKAFGNDEKALQIALAIVQSGGWENLDGNGKLFVLLPLEHSESLEIQNQGLDIWDQLVANSNSPWKEFFEKLRHWAVEHQKVIQQFGRFPHRNVVLGRDSTQEELAYLAQPGAGF